MFDKKEYMKEYNKRWRENHPEYNKQYNKRWRKDNPEYVKQHNKQWHKDNPEYDKQRREKNPEYTKSCYKQWSEDNKEHRKEYKKKWRERNPEYGKEYYRNKLKTNLKYNLNHKIKTAIGISLKGNKAGRHWEDLVGYTLNDLTKRLQSTMPECYTWKDYMEGKLEVDHKVPISAHNFTSPENPDFKRCWALENLQLLPVKENRRKINHLDKPFQPALELC